MTPHPSPQHTRLHCGGTPVTLRFCFGEPISRRGGHTGADAGAAVADTRPPDGKHPCPGLNIRNTPETLRTQRRHAHLRIMTTKNGAHGCMLDFEDDSNDQIKSFADDEDDNGECK
ncbi:hypothetical protein K7X08_029772 [Anisodus acutangulus]|uniref:Uncharacterized protein n=1 Tax=Anisodus acutangulus TaxID=402998 RepID=A0A9Q1MCK2_9SOLA|nr:hypothetical protein K7X08_029772 [Anisodus acutangulus]